MDTTDLNGTDNAWMTYDDGLRLGTGSSAIAAGTATGAPSTDLIGEDRPSTPAIGAYEGIYLLLLKRYLPQRVLRTLHPINLPIQMDGQIIVMQVTSCYFP